ncbi:MAG: histidinol-phosphate transaminase [Candidatus Methanofastidiosia archaeon]
MIEPKKYIQKIPLYDPPLEGRKEKLRLDFNENTVGPSPKVAEVLKRIDPQIISSYPEYNRAYTFFSKFYNIEKGNILATNGTDEAIQLIFDAYVSPGDKVVIPTPTFAIFKLEASLAEATTKEIMYNKDLSFPVEGTINASQDAKLTIIVNPNNPTGSAVDQKIIEKIISSARLVLVDEAYFDFYKKTSLPLVKEYDNIIVTRTFSKAYGLAGLRLGLAFASEDIISTLKKVSSPYSVNSLALECGIAALKDQNYLNKYVEESVASREILKKELEKMGLVVFNSNANFVVCRFGKNASRIAKKLKEKGILVRDRSSYPLLEGCLRIGAGTIKQTEAFITALKKILEGEL